jgi:predicted peroxiredoxin/TusA-related sulfurtransferase
MEAKKGAAAPGPVEGRSEAGTNPDTTQAEPQEVDGRGLSISTAILYEVVTRLDSLEPGGELRVRVDGTPAIDSDIRAWSRTTGHDLILVDERGQERRYLIRKTGRTRSRPPWAFVISDPGLEELLSPLGFALGAALGGSEVALYFQGPGVRVLERGFRGRLKGLHRAPFSGFARRGLARSGHPAPQEKLRQLRALGGRIYACAPSMEHFKVNADDLVFDDIHLAAYPSFVEEMDAAGVQIFLQ